MRFFLTILMIMGSTNLALSQNGQAVTDKKTFSRETAVNIDIQADPAIVWSLLTNASDFKRWNSTIISLDGNIEKGEKIKLVSTVDSTRTFKLKVKKMEAEKEMVWGSGAAPFFKGVRTYTLTQKGKETVQFSMREKLSGMMFPLAAGSIPPFDDSFEQFAKDLKKEAEIIQQGKP